MDKRLLVALGVVALAGVALAMWRTSPSSDDPGDKEQIARGATIYAESFAACHGARLEGQNNWRTANTDGTYPAPPHDVEGHTWHHPDSMLFSYISLGGQEALKDAPGFTSAIPGFGDKLSDQGIRDVLAFIKSRWTECERKYQQMMTKNDG